MVAEITSKLLVGHVAGPDEIAEAYLFLMKYVLTKRELLRVTSMVDFCIRCDYITGQRIEVDGGQRLA